MKAKFYLADMDAGTDRHGKKLPTLKDVLFFALERAALSGDKNVPPHSFEDRARREHVEQYKEAYRAFKAAHPEYKLEWPELDVVVEAPKAEAAVEKESPKAKKAKKEKAAE